MTYRSFCLQRRAPPATLTISADSLRAKGLPARKTNRKGSSMNPIAKIAGTAASLGGVALANKVLAASWTRITGNEPPANNPNEEERWRDIILWSLITGLVGTVIKVSITRAQHKMEAKSLAKNGGPEEI